MTTKGIILAGGSGTRLHPITSVLSKQQLPIYDKPMIYYPLSLMFECGIRDIVIISKPEHVSQYKSMLTKLPVRVNYTFIEQAEPNGIAEAFILAESIITNSPVVLALGDNLFHGIRPKDLKAFAKTNSGATIFGKKVSNPKEYGVALFDDNGIVIRIVEKPTEWISNIAIPGLYFYDNTVVAKTKQLKRSARNELEITDLNNLYIQDQSLKIHILDDDVAWFDTGTADSLFEAAMYVKVVQSRTGNMIGVPEEAAYRSKLITRKELIEYATTSSSVYCKYLVEKLTR